MESTTLILLFLGLFFLLGLSFSISVFFQYRKESRIMKRKIRLMEKNLLWAMEKLEWEEIK